MKQNILIIILIAFIVLLFIAIKKQDSSPEIKELKNQIESLNEQIVLLKALKDEKIKEFEEQRLIIDSLNNSVQKLENKLIIQKNLYNEKINYINSLPDDSLLTIFNRIY